MNTTLLNSILIEGCASLDGEGSIILNLDGEVPMELRLLPPVDMKEGTIRYATWASISDEDFLRVVGKIVRTTPYCAVQVEHVYQLDYSL